MGQDNFKLGLLGRQGEALLGLARGTLGDSDDERLQALAAKVPGSMAAQDGAPQVVFAGEYSAGKSSLIKVLTGRDDIKVGQTITTDRATRYDYNGIQLWDTPGIHTELRPDHDRLSYERIAAADLLLFVITSNLMDDHLAAHFRKLAVDQSKGREMMLVVNWMSAHQAGNSSRAHAVIRQDLARVLRPYTPEDLRVSFTDARLALDSQQEPDADAAREDWEDSGVDAFVEHLNDLVAEKGLAARQTTSLYELEHVLQQAIALVADADPVEEGLEQLLLQKRRAILDGRQRFQASADRKVQQCTALVRGKGRRLSEMVHADMDPEQVQGALKSEQAAVEQLVQQLEQELLADFTGLLQDLRDELEALTQTEFAQQVLEGIQQTLGGWTAGLDPATVRGVKGGADAGARLGNFLVRNAYKPGASTFGGLFKLRHYSGTDVHKAVKAVGKFFGKSFKPWEAVRLTRTIANVGRVLSVVGALLGVAAQAVEDAQKAKQERQLREARQGLRAGFNDAAAGIEDNCTTRTRTLVEHALDPELKEVDQQLAALREARETCEGLHQELQLLAGRCRDLIQQMHAAG